MPRTVAAAAFAAALLLAAAPGALAAQSMELRAGERGRIREVSAGRYAFTFVERVGDTLVVQRAGEAAPRRVPLARVERLDRSLGRHSRWRGFGRGWMYGFAAGAVIGGVSGYAEGDDPAGGWFVATREEKAMGGALLAGATFSLIGGTIGAFRPGERWARVELAPSVSVAPMHGGVGVRVAF